MVTCLPYKGNSTRKKTDGRGGRVDGALLCLPLPNAERLKHLSVPKAARKLAVCMHEVCSNGRNFNRQCWWCYFTRFL